MFNERIGLRGKVKGKLPILSRDDPKNKTEFKRQKQRKLPITSRGAVVMTYSECCSNLSNALFCGDGIPSNFETEKTPQKSDTK
jgi:hypothetical protein